MNDARLFRMLYYLVDKGRVTASELAEKFEVSIRTVYRDVDALSSAGIPIYTISGKGGGIEILDHFVLDKSFLSTDEKSQILASLSGFATLNQVEHGDLQTKLSALFKVNNINWIDVDLTTWRSSDKTLFQTVKTAIFHKRMLTFSYHGSNGVMSVREIKPVRLVFKDQQWYLYGYCLLRNDFRFFKLSRIKKLEITQMVYEDDFDNIEIEHVIKNEEKVCIKLKFDKRFAYRVYDELDEVFDDGEYLYSEVILPKNYSLYYYVLSFGDGVEVLSPLEIREEMIKVINNMNKIYKR